MLSPAKDVCSFIINIFYSLYKQKMTARKTLVERMIASGIAYELKESKTLDDMR